jgi:hypothetical protein
MPRGGLRGLRTQLSASDDHEPSGEVTLAEELRQGLLSAARSQRSTRRSDDNPP